MKTALYPRRLAVAGLLFCFLACFAAFPWSFAYAQDKTEITVSAAISLKDSLDEIGTVFEKSHPGTKVTFNYGASGTLQRQIEQGAPVDIFFSAAEKQMDQLQAKGFVDAGTRRNIVDNQLVLITPVADTSVHSFQDLTNPNVKIVALGEPATVPAGMYAHQTLEKLGLLASVEKKAVYAKDVRAVLTYVETGNADAGMVYQSDAQGSTKVRIVATAPADSHDPIVYPAAVLNGAKNLAAGRMLLEFMSGPEARDVFSRHGFAAVEKQAVTN
ncbi:MAG TPA: molybdate ABC transporter substrate-binding protein [Candidatus Acidoferrales bacterium]